LAAVAYNGIMLIEREAWLDWSSQALLGSIIMPCHFPQVAFAWMMKKFVLLLCFTNVHNYVSQAE